MGIANAHSEIRSGLLGLAEASQPYFSLGEEARYTERHQSWNSDLKLRHSSIAFVSAGTSNAEELTHSLQEKGKENIEASIISVQAKHNNTSDHQQTQPIKQFITAEAPMSKMRLSDTLSIEASDLSDERELENNLQSVPEQIQPRIEGYNGKITDELYFTDITGSGQPVNTSFPPPTIHHSPSPAPSDSSEEVVLFVGRNRSQAKSGTKTNHVTPPQHTRKLRLQAQYSSPEVSRQPITTGVGDSANDSLKDSTSPHRRTSPLLRVPAVLSPSETRAQAVRNDEGYTNKRNRRKRNLGERSRRAEEEAEILADYIKNTRNSDGLNGFTENSALNLRDLGGSDNAEWEDEEEEHQPNSALKEPDDWDSADLQDFDELSTSNEALDVVDQVLSKRERASGTQYLVVGAGYTIDDARWLPLHALDLPSANELIKVFEEEQAEFERLLDKDDQSDDSLDSDEQIALDLQEEIDDLEDEKDLEERRIARMTDEQIARLLSKQEELGLGSDDLKLFDGGEEVEEDEVEPQLDGVWEGPSSVQTPSSSNRKKRNQPNFPCATALADVLEQDPYNGFDVMDQDRPSLRKKPKGRRGKLPLELSDAELEQQIQAAWENDRSKKKQRKQEREELRAQGLLGKKGKPDLKAKYKEGMSMIEVKNEIKVFLTSTKETYSSLTFHSY